MTTRHLQRSDYICHIWGGRLPEDGGTDLRDQIRSKRENLVAGRQVQGIFRSPCRYPTRTNGSCAQRWPKRPKVLVAPVPTPRSERCWLYGGESCLGVITPAQAVHTLKLYVFKNSEDQFRRGQLFTSRWNHARRQAKRHHARTRSSMRESELW